MTWEDAIILVLSVLGSLGLLALVASSLRLRSEEQAKEDEIFWASVRREHHRRMHWDGGM